MSNLVRLEDHALKIGSGQTPRGGEISYAKFGIPLIRSQNVLMGSFSREGLAFISPEMNESMSGSQVFPRDVLLNITGASIGRVCVVPEEICPANVNQHVCIIRCDDTLQPEYVAALLASPKFQSMIWESQAGGTRQALTKQMIEDFEIPWLPEPAQIETASRVKERFAEATIARKAAEVQLGEISSLADAIVMDSVQRHRTDDCLLGDVLNEVKRGIGTTWRDYPVMGATREGLAPAKEPPGKHPMKYKPVFPGTVFYNPMRILIGSIAFVDEDESYGITSPDYVALQGTPGRVDSRWFYYWLRSPLGGQCINSLARGAVRERMLFNRLAEGRIHLPEFAIQQRASAALCELKSLKTRIQQQLVDIDLLPHKILSQAFEN
jgi:type I restriction enzyme S subunit